MAHNVLRALTDQYANVTIKIVAVAVVMTVGVRVELSLFQQHPYAQCSILVAVSVKFPTEGGKMCRRLCLITAIAVCCVTAYRIRIFQQQFVFVVSNGS
jgi:hypothetical protein